MNIREIGFVTLRELSGGEFVCRHTFLAEGFEVNDKALLEVRSNERLMETILGGPVILSYKTQAFVATEVLAVFTLEISHDPVQGPREDPLQLAAESLQACLKKLSLYVPSDQIEGKEWKQLISFESSTGSGEEIIRGLKKRKNQPTVAGNLTCLAGHITRLNDRLRRAGLMFEIRSIEPEKKGMISQRFKLVRTV